MAIHTAYGTVSLAVSAVSNESKSSTLESVGISRYVDITCDERCINEVSQEGVF